MRAFVGPPQFKGIWDEDLNNNIYVFYTLAEIYEVNDDEKPNPFQ